MADLEENNTAGVDWAKIVPKDSILVVIRSGKRTYAKGHLLGDTQEQTVDSVQSLFRRVIDTIDMFGIKKGGPKKDDRA